MAERPKADLDVGTLLGGGTTLLRRRPGSVLIWTLLSVAAFAGANLMARQIGQANPGSDTGGFSYFLILLLFALLTPVLFTAAMRAILQPGESEFASLDAGMGELRVIGIFVIFSIFYAISNWITVLAFGGIVLATQSAVVAAMAMVIPVLVAACLFARLSLAYPLALIRGRIQLDEPWRLSQGYFWPFFLAYVIIALAMSALGLAILALTDWPGFARLFGGGAPGNALQWLRVGNSLDLMTIVGWGLEGIRSTLGIIFVAGATAAGAQVLVPDKKELTETFS